MKPVYKKVCPQCTTEGLESKLHLGVGFTTSAGAESYHDSQGRLHVHDRNETCGDWSCSAGHKGKYSSYRACKAKDCDHAGAFYMQVIAPPTAEEVAAAEAEKELRRIQYERDAAASPHVEQDHSIVGGYVTYVNSGSIGNWGPNPFTTNIPARVTTTVSSANTTITISIKEGSITINDANSTRIINITNGESSEVELPETSAKKETGENHN